ncbi:MAG: hypothetical protein Q7K55_02125 [Candidatus Levybacteria bacterium]|nr:hypothetical protein [Candidatus Levybacteria bacterium]
MNKKDLIDKTVIVITTSYNLNKDSDKIRAELSKKTIKKAHDLGYEIIIVDEGSPGGLIKTYRDFGAKVYQSKSKGMGNGKRQAIKIAFDLKKEVIVLMEPEKIDYVSGIIKTVEPILTVAADIVVPKRKSLISYPLVQQYSETLLNFFVKELTGLDLDISFGPRTFKRDLCNYFLDYKGEYGDKWDSLYIPVLNAIHDKRNILSVDVDYTHPKEQTEVEEHDLEFFKKRVDLQLCELTDILRKHWKKIKKNK